MAKRPTHLRKVPTQDRSRRRLEAILDAAARLFADTGFEGTTIDAIAAEADTSVGSVYQFFPNKLAIFRGIAERSHDRVRTAYTALVGVDPRSRDIGELIDAVVDGFFALQRADASFRAVWTNTQLYGELEADDLVLERELVTATGEVIAAHAPEIPARRRDIIARVMVQTVSAGLFLVLRDPELEDARALISELKRMLRAYAETLLRAG
jgi:AcrR family transcriptional regulator